MKHMPSISADGLDDELQAVVDGLIHKRHPTLSAIASIDRQPLVYRSSFNLDELRVTFDEGETLSLLLKDLSRSSLLPAARAAKPGFLYDPMREITVYERLLGDAPHGPPLVYGSCVDPARDRYWLILEKVHGSELYQVGDSTLWEDAARWLARFHGRFRGIMESSCDEVHRWLLQHDAVFYQRWMTRAVEIQGRRPNRRQRVQWLAKLHPRVVDFLVEQPRVLLHGEFYASNVLVTERPNCSRVCPVDWEMAAIGPAVTDVAALTVGNWSAGDRHRLLTAYWSANRNNEPYGSIDAFVYAVRVAQLQLAIQWLGWSDDWLPPATQAWDWLGEATRLAQMLRL